MTRRTRKTVAVVCIALVLVAGMLPAISTDLAAVVLVALGIVAPTTVVAAMLRVAARVSTEQPIGLLVLLDPRGPPRLAALL